MYLDWLQNELKSLPIIPIQTPEQQTQMQVDDIYVPIRVIGRAQMEDFRKLV